MSSSDVAAVVGAVQWGDEGSYVREVAARGPLPQLAKVIKGQYLGVGVPSLANPGLASTLLLLSAGRGLRVAAQCVKFKEGRRVVPVGPKLTIPESYDGFFEILSEDGRAVRCMESVAELAKRFPDSALVRESIKAYVSRSDDVDTITEKSRAVQSGETLVLVGEVIGSKNGKSQHRFLRCFDQAGQNVYLPYDARGKFSAIAKEDNISGVHSIRNLLNKRLPLMVRMVHGRPPVGAKAASQFLPELRLFAAFSEEPLAALPLGKDAPLILLPPQAPLKLAHARNADQVEKTKEFMRLCERATSLLQEVADRIHVYDVSHIKSPYASGEQSTPSRRSQAAPMSPERADARPTPPPIETIPTRRGGEQRAHEKLSPSVHPALISAALDRATERRVEKRSRKPEDKKGGAHQQVTPQLSQHSQQSPAQLTSPSTPLQEKPSNNKLFLRYKSLTNLAMDFDTLDSSTSGGKGSADSGGSAAIKAKLPEKRSRKLTRPKSLTNLVWDGRGGGGGGGAPPDALGMTGTARALLEAERKLRLEPGVYRHARDAPALLAATTRLLASQKKIGTLYL
ncbi:Protein FAM59A [Penaeus vannamei]|uniref:Protein FAM59A n=1 Tax=Penaeus vannamei TaxID=6689 RepID=A0A3R7MVY3_PENVA|nr:Protein FAM59A [Penaeus vannamei]